MFDKEDQVHRKICDKVENKIRWGLPSGIRQHIRKCNYVEIHNRVSSKILNRCKQKLRRSL